jgi:hypothetical protein
MKSVILNDTKGNILIETVIQQEWSTHSKSFDIIGLFQYPAISSIRTDPTWYERCEITIETFDSITSLAAVFAIE